MQSVATITVAALRNCRHNGREEGATQGFCRTVRGGPGLAGGELMARRSVSRRQSHLRRRDTHVIAIRSISPTTSADKQTF